MVIGRIQGVPKKDLFEILCLQILMKNLVHFGPFWTMSDNFGHLIEFWTFFDTLDHFDCFGPFGPFWTTLDRLAP